MISIPHFRSVIAGVTSLAWLPRKEPFHAQQSVFSRLLSMGNKETEFLNKSLKISRNSKMLHDQFIHVFITLRLQLLGANLPASYKNTSSFI